MRALAFALLFAACARPPAPARIIAPPPAYGHRVVRAVALHF